MSETTVAYSEISSKAEDVLSKCFENMDRPDLKEWLQVVTKNTSSTLLLISDMEDSMRKLEPMMSYTQTEFVQKNKVKSFFKIKSYSLLLDHMLLARDQQSKEDLQLIIQICFDSVMEQLYAYSEGMNNIVAELMG